MASSSPLRRSPRRKAAAASVTSAAMTAAAAIVTPQHSIGFAPAPVTSSRYFSSHHDHPSRMSVKPVKPSRLFSETARPTSATSAATSDAAKKPKIERTNSFQPVWTGSLESSDESAACVSDVHTLVLGTHPSIASLNESQYFGHHQNAYWWIAGDCLGFRRQMGVNAEGKRYKLTQYLRHDEGHVIPYDEQLRIFTSKGFALWDVIKSCERKGSLDADIKNEEPNDIRGFCENHQSVKRIVLANGGTGCTMFNRYFKDWWLSGELKPGKNVESQKAFDKFAKKTNNFRDAKIEVISAISVSPAAARYSYEEKRAFWEEYVYCPGLKDHEKQQHT